MGQLLQFQLVITNKYDRFLWLVATKKHKVDLYVEHIMFIVEDINTRNELLLLLRFALHVINVLVLSLVKVLLQVVSPPRVVDAKWVKSFWKSATSSSLSNNSVVKSRFSRIIRNSREFSLLDLGLEAF